MAQLQPFWYGDKLHVEGQNGATQAITHNPYLHGKDQNYKSIDCWGLNTPDPLGFKVSNGLQFKVIGKSGSGQGSAVKYQVIGYKLQLLFVHSTSENKSIYNSGEKCGHSTWSHWHLSGIIDGVYHDIREFLDRSVCVTDKNWDNVVQRDLNGLLFNNQDMVTLQNALNCITINTVSMNVRQSPSTSAPVIDHVAPNTPFTTNIVASGDLVGGNPNWYGYKTGYISQAYVKEIPAIADCSVQDKKIVELSSQNKIYTDKLVEINKTSTL